MSENPTPLNQLLIWIETNETTLTISQIKEKIEALKEVEEDFISEKFNDGYACGANG